ncbi:hypothetical protein [Cohnella rhizosphaerae]|uniref:Uncharacterized protein n=1 Tax=Cohnella rhizosphaerae TaxID=1457232 RepID=A0A9X4KYK6_9BACL|nr:hypothetical protein [Cohnella rhizosphaerae]MDG0813153.1 hypothetical protein [Cohnella rhizosphaerae]
MKLEVRQEMQVIVVSDGCVCAAFHNRCDDFLHFKPDDFFIHAAGLFDAVRLFDPGGGSPGFFASSSKLPSRL